MSQTHRTNANDYRRRAQTCAVLADCAQSPGDRERLIGMRDTCIALAKNKDWLDGLPPLPPANVNALAIAY